MITFNYEQLSDETLRDLQGQHLNTIGSVERQIGSAIAAGRAIERAVLERIEPAASILTGDEVRAAVKVARDCTAPSDVTSPADYVIAGASAQREKMERQPSASEADPYNYKGMFEGAVSALAEIDRLLGLADDGCNDPQVTVSALADFIGGHKDMQKSRDELLDDNYQLASEAGFTVEMLEAGSAATGYDLSQDQVRQVWTAMWNMRTARARHDAALAAAKSEQQDGNDVEDKAAVLGELNDDLAEILGRMCFSCIRIAELFRLNGQTIARKAEAEQAAVIYFLLRAYLRHGKEWATHAAAELKAMADAARAQRAAAQGEE